jgi:hypothetical protein
MTDSVVTASGQLARLCMNGLLFVGLTLPPAGISGPAKEPNGLTGLICSVMLQEGLCHLATAVSDFYSPMSRIKI